MNPDYKSNSMKIPVVKPIELKNVKNFIILSFSKTNVINKQ